MNEKKHSPIFVVYPYLEAYYLLGIVNRERSNTLERMGKTKQGLHDCTSVTVCQALATENFINSFNWRQSSKACLAYYD